MIKKKKKKSNIKKYLKQQQLQQTNKNKHKYFLLLLQKLNFSILCKQFLYDFVLKLTRNYRFDLNSK